jgi:hypothetical protein
MGGRRLSQDPDLSYHVLKFKGTLTSLLGTKPLPTQGDLGTVVALFLGGVPVVLGHKFSSLFFNGETIEVVGDFNGE